MLRGTHLGRLGHVDALRVLEVKRINLVNLYGTSRQSVSGCGKSPGETDLGVLRVNKGGRKGEQNGVQIDHEAVTGNGSRIYLHSGPLGVGVGNVTEEGENSFSTRGSRADNIIHDLI